MRTRSGGHRLAGQQRARRCEDKRECRARVDVSSRPSCQQAKRAACIAPRPRGQQAATVARGRAGLGAKRSFTGCLRHDAHSKRSSEDCCD